MQLICREWLLCIWGWVYHYLIDSCGHYHSPNDPTTHLTNLFVNSKPMPSDIRIRTCIYIYMYTCMHITLLKVNGFVQICSLYFRFSNSPVHWITSLDSETWSISCSTAKKTKPRFQTRFLQSKQLSSFDTPFATLKNLKAIRFIAELMKNLTRKNHMARQIINWGPPQPPSPSQSDRTFCDCFCWQQPTTCRHLTVFRNWNRGICWNVLRGPFSGTTNWATKKI